MAGIPVKRLRDPHAEQFTMRLFTASAMKIYYRAGSLMSEAFRTIFLEIMDLKIGDSFSIERAVTDELVRAFAELSGDHNPLHLDEEYARSTRFGRRIAHGMLSGAFISAVLGYEFKERKIVYLSQTMRFVAPVYIGDTVTTTATVTHIREDKPIFTLSTVCKSQDGVITLEGEAVVMML